MVHVWDVKAMYDIFVKELDTYPEPIQYVWNTYPLLLQDAF